MYVSLLHFIVSQDFVRMIVMARDLARESKELNESNTPNTRLLSMFGTSANDPFHISVVSLQK